MENSPFAKLPAELRNQIYHLVLTQSKAIRIDSRQSGDKIWCEDVIKGKLLALTRTCRVIREESIRIFYATNTFQHRASTEWNRWLKSVRNFDSQIGIESAAAIRSVIVALPNTRFVVSFPLWFSDHNVETVRELFGIASENHTRTYQLRSTLFFETIDEETSWWQDVVLSDMRNFEAGCDELRAGVRQEVNNTNDPETRSFFLDMDEVILKWQARILHATADESGD